MRRSYKTLTNAEYNTLCKLIRNTGSDCWAVILQDSNGTDYIYDLEERKRWCLKTGVSMLAESIDDQDCYDNCFFEMDEKIALRGLFEKLNIEFNHNWKIDSAKDAI